MTNKEETDVTESQIVRASVLKSHGWSSEQNRSQCKFRNKFSCFFVILIFSFRSSLLLFILRDTYIDDFLIAWDDESQHREHLKILFNRLNNYGVVINPTKCEFGVHEITFLGYSVNSDGIKPPPERVEAIIKLSKPANAKQLRRYLGMINFYRRFIPRATKTLKPLNDLLKGAKKGNAPIEWSEQSENS